MGVSPQPVVLGGELPGFSEPWNYPFSEGTRPHHSTLFYCSPTKKEGIIPSMEWDVLLHPDFETWLLEQERGVRLTITAHAKLLRQCGPALGRPQVDTLKGSKLANLKELRIQYQGAPWRILFVFDPKRQAILLVGGNKEGNARWYRTAIPLAEQRYQEHLKELEHDHGKKT